MEASHLPFRKSRQVIVAEATIDECTIHPVRPFEGRCCQSTTWRSAQATICGRAQQSTEPRAILTDQPVRSAAAYSIYIARGRRRCLVWQCIPK